MENKVKNIRFLEDSLLIDNKILVICDLHFGIEENSGDFGLLPRFQFKETIEKINKIFNMLDMEKIILDKIIILGDLKHEFSENINSEWRDSLRFLDFIKKKCEEIIIIKGNHDNYLVNIVDKRKIKLVEYYKYKDICFFHGDKDIEDSSLSKIFIVGHLHPAITISDDYKKEKYKCFLKGKWKRKEVYIIPSFNPIGLGYELSNLEINNKNFDFIIKEKELLGFEVIIYNPKENKEYYFGKLKKMVK
jgi:uncharacterized protein